MVPDFAGCGKSANCYQLPRRELDPNSASDTIKLYVSPSGFQTQQQQLIDSSRSTVAILSINPYVLLAGALFHFMGAGGTLDDGLSCV